MAKRERILLKISGGNLKREDESYFFNKEIIDNLVDQIEIISKSYAVSLVVGGGNIWRGNSNNIEPINNQWTHYIGMLATLMNAITIQNFLSSKNIRSRIFTSLSCPRVAEEFNPDKINESLDKDEVVIFAGGTGMPYVSTDTCAAIRAIEIGAQKILIGKNNVKGVYDKDPKKYTGAMFLSNLTYEDIIKRELCVLDQTALVLLLPYRPKLLIFNQDVKDSFVKALNNQIEHTVIE